MNYKNRMIVKLVIVLVCSFVLGATSTQCNIVSAGDDFDTLMKQAIADTISNFEPTLLVSTEGVLNPEGTTLTIEQFASGTTADGGNRPHLGIIWVTIGFPEGVNRNVAFQCLIAYNYDTACIITHVSPDLKLK